MVNSHHKRGGKKIGRKARKQDNVKTRVRPDGVVPHEMWCEAHRKYAFTRENARRTARRMTGGNQMREYKCEALVGERQLWHIGHLPLVVQNGTITAREYYERRGRESNEHDEPR